jgi:hypothetical protein
MNSNALKLFPSRPNVVKTSCEIPNRKRRWELLLKSVIKTNRNRMPDLRLKSIKKRNLKWKPTLRRKNDPKTDRECRTLLKKLLDDNSLDALPGHSKAKDVVGHKFVDLQVRKKAERRVLPAFECADCRNFYARANLDEDQLRDLLQVTLLS